MNHIRRISRLVHFRVALVGAMLGLAVLAPAAFAMRVRASGGFPSGALTDPRPAVTHSVVASGMTGWQITVIVTLVAVLAATIAIIVDRARAAAHRTGMVPAN
jgi:hypothetical protein